MIEIRWRPDDKELRIFAGSQVVLCGIVAAMLWNLGRTTPAIVVGALSLLVTLVGWVLPQAIRRVYVTWMVAAFPIGWVFLHLVLAGVYYLIIWPVGGARRICGWDPMHRRWDASAKTYWQERSPPPSPGQYYRQF
jgi:hypothetical protein